MTKEEFIEQIKDIKINVPDEYFFLDYNKIVYNILDMNEKLQQDKDNLIKYLENTIKENEKFDRKNNCEWQGYGFYQEILERLKSEKYD